MFFTYLTGLISVLTPIIIAVLSILFNRKINKKDKETLKRDSIRLENEKIREELNKNFILDKLESLEIKFTDLEISVNTHMDETDFRLEFSDKISNKASQILIHLKEFLTPEQNSILNYWSNVIESFGLDFFDSSKRRGRKKKLDNYLSQALENHLSDFDNYVDSIYEEIRVYKKEKVFFSQFIDRVKLHGRTESLKMKCVSGSFKDDQDIIGEFVEYIEEFFSDFTKGVRIWNLLPIYEKENAA